MVQKPEEKSSPRFPETSHDKTSPFNMNTPLREEYNKKGQIQPSKKIFNLR